MRLILRLINVLWVIVFVGSCAPKNSDSASTNPSSSPTSNIDIKEWIKLEGPLFTNAGTTFYIAPIISHDKKWLYFPTQGFAGNIGALDIGVDIISSFQDKNKWTKLSWVEGFSDSPGKAAFSDTGHILSLNPASDGLLVSWLDGKGAKHGALYVRENKLVHAWKVEGTHLTGMVVPHEISNFFAINKNNVDVPYLLAIPTGLGGGGRALFTHHKLENSPFSTLVALGAAASKGAGLFAQNQATAFLVTRDGIASLPVNDAGTNKSFSAVAKNTPIFGSDAWNMGDPMTDNFNVSSILLRGDKLYVGLNAPHANQGGVAILDIAANNIIAPQKSIWHRVNVRHLFVDSGDKVWAVTSKELLEVKADGTIGEKLNADVVAKNTAATAEATMIYKGEMPTDNIFGAQYFGDTLILHTDHDVYLLKHTKAIK